jgi:hypothetical protein
MTPARCLPAPVHLPPFGVLATVEQGQDRGLGSLGQRRPGGDEASQIGVSCSAFRSPFFRTRAVCGNGAIVRFLSFSAFYCWGFFASLALLAALSLAMRGGCPFGPTLPHGGHR